jgi:MEMO1 family protein
MNRCMREPAVAGLFYEKDKQSLTDHLKQLFRDASEKRLVEKPVAALIVPHAGYLFSGEVAASAFVQLPHDATYDNIFIIGSSHKATFKGASIYNNGNFKTPLGELEVNCDLATKLIDNHEVFNNFGEAHLKEHCLEVQLPFLQYHLHHQFKIVPIVIGSYDNAVCMQLAAALQPYFNSRNLFVISTDFSHYPRYEDAVEVDKLTANAIISGDPEKLIAQLKYNTQLGIGNLHTSLCGWTSVLTLLYLTKKSSDLTYHDIQYKNSGDSKFGDKSGVVGYYAIAVTRNKPTQFYLSDADKTNLLAVARNQLTTVLKSKKDNVQIGDHESKALMEPAGAFVSLYKNGKLRGCIGQFGDGRPLRDVVRDVTKSSALHDHRFSPVRANELDDITIEISVLTPLKPISDISQINMGKHGIYIKKGNRSGTFLPQVVAKTDWTLDEFLGHCARDKAGIGWDGWRNADLFVYEAIVFSEYHPLTH